MDKFEDAHADGLELDVVSFSTIRHQGDCRNFRAGVCGHGSSSGTSVAVAIGAPLTSGTRAAGKAGTAAKSCPLPAQSPPLAKKAKAKSEATGSGTSAAAPGRIEWL